MAIQLLFFAEGWLLNLGRTTGHPSFVISNSLNNQIMAQIELWSKRGSGEYKDGVYLLPKKMDEKVALLNLAALGAEMTPD